MPRPDVALGDRHDEAQVGLGQLGLGVLAVVDGALEPAAFDGLERAISPAALRSARRSAAIDAGLDALGQVDLLLAR